MNTYQNYIESLKNLQLAQHAPPVVPTQRVIELAAQINAWHKTLPVPECWQPLQLGRIAATFGVTREMAASALKYGRWKEQRQGATSLWHLPTP